MNQLRTERVLETIRRFGVEYDRMWIFNKIHHEINQFCSKHSLREVVIDLFDTLDENLMKALQQDCDKFNTGIDIITVRVTKPRVPDVIRQNYENIEAEKAKLFLAQERHKTIAKEAETEMNRAKIEAEKNKAVQQIQLEAQVLEKEAQKRIAAIEDEIVADRHKRMADSALYEAERLAEADKKRLTPEFLAELYITSAVNDRFEMCNGNGTRCSRSIG